MLITLRHAATEPHGHGIIETARYTDLEARSFPMSVTYNLTAQNIYILTQCRQFPLR